MRSSLLNDVLELFWLNESISILVKLVESLTDALALEASEHLRELRVGHRVCLLAAANVKLDPFGLPVEWKRALIHVRLHYAAEVVPSDKALVISVEETESHVIFGIWLSEEVLVRRELSDSEALRRPVSGRDAEKDAKLFALNLVLCFPRNSSVKLEMKCTINMNGQSGLTHEIFSALCDNFDELFRAQDQLSGLLISVRKLLKARMCVVGEAR